MPHPVRGAERRGHFGGPPFRPSSCRIVSERSSPSRVRYAAPNNGAPLTAPVRSEQTLPLRGKELVLVSGPPRRHFGPFSDCHRHAFVSALRSVTYYLQKQYAHDPR